MFRIFGLCNGLWKGEHSRVRVSGARMCDVSVCYNGIYMYDMRHNIYDV